MTAQFKAFTEFVEDAHSLDKDEVVIPTAEIRKGPWQWITVAFEPIRAKEVAHWVALVLAWDYGISTPADVRVALR